MRPLKQRLRRKLERINALWAVAEQQRGGEGAKGTTAFFVGWKNQEHSAALSKESHSNGDLRVDFIGQKRILKFDVGSPD